MEGYQRYYHEVNKVSNEKSSTISYINLESRTKSEKSNTVMAVSPQDSDIQYVICNAKLEQYINRTLNQYDAKLDDCYGKFDKIMSNIDNVLTEEDLKHF